MIIKTFITSRVGGLLTKLFDLLLLAKFVTKIQGSLRGRFLIEGLSRHTSPSNVNQSSSSDGLAEDFCKTPTRWKLVLETPRLDVYSTIDHVLFAIDQDRDGLETHAWALLMLGTLLGSELELGAPLTLGSWLTEG